MNSRKGAFPVALIIPAVIAIALVIALAVEITSGKGLVSTDTDTFTESKENDSKTDIASSDSDRETGEDTIDTVVIPATDESSAYDTADSSAQTTAPATETTAEASDTDPVVDTTEAAWVDDGHDIVADGLIITGNRAMEFYYCSEKYTAQYAMLVNKYAVDLEGIATVYSCVVPKPAAFYLQDSEEHGKLQAQTANALNIINENLSSDVVSVDLYSALQAHRDEYIYFRTDHHWTGLGAYYAAEAMAKAAGVPFDDISEYDTSTREGYLGSMYKYTGYNKRLENNPDDFVTYIPKTPYKGYLYDYNFENPEENPNGVYYRISESRVSYWYSTYILGDSGSFLIDTEVENGRKLLIIKDSFGNALAPYFMSSFDEIYIVDFRYFKKNVIQFVKDNGITDVAIVLNTFNAGSTPNTNLEVLRTQK